MFKLQKSPTGLIYGNEPDLWQKVGVFVPVLYAENHSPGKERLRPKLGSKFKLKYVGRHGTPAHPYTSPIQTMSRMWGRPVRSTTSSVEVPQASLLCLYDVPALPQWLQDMQSAQYNGGGGEGGLGVRGIDLHIETFFFFKKKMSCRFGSDFTNESKFLQCFLAVTSVCASARI